MEERNMKKYLILLSLAAALMCLFSCGHKDNPETKTLDITGEWSLSDIQTKAPSIGGVSVHVYIAFDNGAFTLYQKIGEGRYVKFSGTYSLEGDLLSGQYSTGSAWGAQYRVSLTEDTLSLTVDGGSETDVYKKSPIPDEVKNSAI